MSICALWIHITTNIMLSRLYIYILIDLFEMMTSLKTTLMLYKNVVLNQSCFRIRFAKRNANVQISFFIFRSWNVKIDQYVNLWISFIRFWQNHFYTIVSWIESVLIFLIEFHDDFVNILLSKIMTQKQKRKFQIIRRTFFTKSHEITTNMNCYDNILMFANEYEIIDQLLHIKQLIRDYNQCKIKTRRIHLIWQLKKK